MLATKSTLKEELAMTCGLAPLLLIGATSTSLISVASSSRGKNSAGASIAAMAEYLKAHFDLDWLLDSFGNFLA